MGQAVGEGNGTWPASLDGSVIRIRLAKQATRRAELELSFSGVVQIDAWLLRDDTSLPENVERFLNDGAPPIYLGFGSMSAPAHTGPMLVEAARRVGRRPILLQGWGNLGASDRGDDCLVVGDVNHQKLFPRVAAILHHGGSGTTTAATRAGRPQVVSARCAAVRR